MDINQICVDYISCLLTALQKQDVRPSDITHVVCTHGHSDHVGCNYLFLQAKMHVTGHTASVKDRYSMIDDSPFEVDENITIIKTPGHTLDSVTVLVKNSTLTPNRLAICGDLFERVEDCFNKKIWIEAGSEAPYLQLEHRRHVAEICDIIIPGHGPLFAVTEEILTALRTCNLDESGEPGRRVVRDNTPIDEDEYVEIED